MKKEKIKFEQISFADIDGLPEMDCTFTASRVYADGNFYDIVACSGKTLRRWHVPAFVIPGAVDSLQKEIPSNCLPLGLEEHGKLCGNFLMQPHVAQLSPGNKLIISQGEVYNGLCLQVLDTTNHQLALLPADCRDNLMCYSATGDFSRDKQYFLYARWPLADAAANLAGAGNKTSCEVRRLNLETMNDEIITLLPCNGRIHQITCSPDGRYAVFCSFTWDMNLPYPSGSPAEDPEGYRLSHEAGMKQENLVTVDLQTGSYRQTSVPAPVPAHSEFDPVDEKIFYLSAHNFHPVKGGVMLEGPATIFKLRLEQGHSSIISSYTDDHFFRISQHVPFRYGGRVLIAVTNLPNKLDLIDGETMTLWRRIKLFEAPEIDFSATGNQLCPVYPESCFSLCPSEDGRYIILESSECFKIYDLQEDRLLKAVIPLQLPAESRVIGHMRRHGE